MSLLPEAPSRNRLAGLLLDGLLFTVDRYESDGVAPFLEEWLARDVVRDRAVALHLAGGTVEGTARGIDEDGALLLETDGVLQRFASGEVSLRLAP